jgi:hypothetical protein
MLDLVQIALDADLLAAQARNRRCCDALRPCPACTSLRLGVRARRIIIRSPRGCIALFPRLAPRAAVERLAGLRLAS